MYEFFIAEYPELANRKLIPLLQDNARAHTAEILVEVLTRKISISKEMWKKDRLLNVGLEV